MKIYISGRISGLTEKEYKENFNLARFNIVNIRHLCLHSEIINPLDIKPLFGIKKWLFFMGSDLLALRKCTHIAMHPNLIESKGAVFILKLKVIWL